MKKSNKMILLSIIVLSGVAMWMFAKQSSKLGFDSNNAPTFFLNIITHKKIVGNNNVISKTLPLPPFNDINIAGNFAITVDPGEQSNATLTGDENILPYINSTVNDNRLFIAPQRGVIFSQKKPTQISVVAPLLFGMHINGNSTLQAKNINYNVDSLNLFLNGNSKADIQGKIKKPEVIITGNSQLKLDVTNADSIDILVQGNGKALISGTAKNIGIVVDGNGSVDASNLVADNANVGCQGNATISVHAVKTMTINSIGNSSINYIGNPQINKTTIGKLTLTKADNISVNSNRT